MNTYNQSWRTFRLNHGLCWRKNYPSLPDIPNGKTALIIALCCFLAISLICVVHYHNEANTEAVKRCDIHGQSVWPDAKAHFYFNNDTGLGYGKTVAVCRGVELIGV